MEGTRPYIAIGDDFLRLREEYGKDADAWMREVQKQGNKLESLLALSRHPAFVVFLDEIRALRSVAISLTPKGDAERVDRDGLIRAWNWVDEMFSGLEKRAHALAKEADPQ